MADQWYFWHETEILGPFSGQELLALATAGDIIPTDTVWKNGIEGGVPASRIQHLFPAVLADIPVDELLASAESPAAAIEEAPAAAPVESAAKPAEAVVPVPVNPPQRWGDGGGGQPKNKARATAGKGAVIMGQDGVTVRFRMKCTECKYEDSSWKTLPIARGTMRVVFYCPKCRKRRQCEINGYLS